MKYLEKHLVINDKIQRIFDILFNTNHNIYTIHTFETSNWFVQRNTMYRKDYVYIYLDALPEELKEYTTENDKFVQLSIKHKIKRNLRQHKKIKTKINILNINPSVQSDLVKIKIITELDELPDNKVSVNIFVFLVFCIPDCIILESFLQTIFTDIMDILESQMQKNI